MSDWKNISIKLISKDRFEYDLKLDAVIHSGLIKALLHISDEDITNNSIELSDNIEIPLGEINSNILSKIINYLNYITYDNSDINKFFEDFLKDIDNDTLFDIIIGTNYLEIKYLLDLTCKVVADEIKQCSTPQEIRKKFNIVNDFTPEEEEEIHKENAWCMD